MFHVILVATSQHPGWGGRSKLYNPGGHWHPVRGPHPRDWVGWLDRCLFFLLTSSSSSPRGIRKRCWIFENPPP